MAGGAGAALRAAQQRAHARDELVRAERLRQVVVGAELETDDALGFLGAGGEHDDRDRGGRLVRAHDAADLEAVDVRQHQVEHDQIRAAGRAIGCSASRPDATRSVTKPALSRYRADELGDVRIVLDDQDARRHARHSTGDDYG